MDVLHRYRRLFALSGVGFVLVGYLARLPLAMSQIGTLLLVSTVTGSFGLGGLAAGSLAIANAIFSPVAGALTDRYGQRVVLLVQSLGAGAGLAALVVLASPDLAWPVLLGVAAFAGAMLPQVGTMARVRWRELGVRSGADRGRVIETAFAYEGVADELSYVIGPALIGLLAVLQPRLALSVAAGLIVIFGVLFAVHPTAAVTGPQARTSNDPTQRLLTPALVLVVLAMACMGAVFGSVQTGTSVLATAAGQPGLAGLLHGLLGIGSVIAGLLLPVIAHRVTPVARWRVFAAGLVLLALPLLGVQQVWHLVIVLVVLGFLIAPKLITIFTLGERVAPPARLATAMTLINAMNGIGYALGAGVAGQLADRGGHTPAFAVTVAACGLGLLLALAGGRSVRAAARVG